MHTATESMAPASAMKKQTYWGEMSVVPKRYGARESFPMWYGGVTSEALVASHFFRYPDSPYLLFSAQERWS